MGFLIRSTSFYTDIRCIKILYCALVRPLLEYGSIVWSPFFICHVKKLERVQRRFLRYIGYKNNMLNNNNQNALNDIQNSLNLNSLYSRMKNGDISFLSKLICGSITRSPLLEHIPFHVPQYNSRTCPTFHIKTHRFIYGQNNPFERLLKLGNESGLDFFQ